MSSKRRSKEYSSSSDDGRPLPKPKRAIPEKGWRKKSRQEIKNEGVKNNVQVSLTQTLKEQHDFNGCDAVDGGEDTFYDADDNAALPLVNEEEEELYWRESDAVSIDFNADADYDEEDEEDEEEDNELIGGVEHKNELDSSDEEDLCYEYTDIKEDDYILDDMFLRHLYGKDYSIVNDCNAYRNRVDAKQGCLDIPLHDGSSATVADFFRGYLLVAIRHGASDALRMETIDFIKSNGLFDCSSLGSAKGIEEFCRPFDRRMMTYDGCPAGCMMFAGSSKDKRVCGVENCRRARYRPCSHRCTSEETCTHIKDRTPWLSVNYRPIVGTLQELLELESFRWCLDWKLHHMFESSCFDVSQGRHYQMHMGAMKTHYLECVPEEERDNTLMINLLLSRGYDGAQIYRSKVSTFWPYMISILNLSPPLRSDIGIGLFLVYLFTGPVGTEIENFLARSIYDELRALYKGISFTTRAGRRIFLQARLILHQLDSKAMEKEFGIQMSTAAVPCPLCRGVTGVYYKTLKACSFTGIRRMTDPKHPVRYVGQSTQCCAYGTHFNKVDSVEKYIEDCAASDSPQGISCKIIQSFRRKSSNTPRTANLDTAISCDVEGTAGPTFPYDNEKWLHGNICEFEDFANGLWAPDCDFRRKWEYRRVTTRQYREAAVHSQAIGQSVKGIKHLTLASKVPYFSFKRDVNSDFFHIAMDWGKEDFAILKGNRANSIRVVNDCTAKLIHLPYLHSSRGDKEEPPWIVAERFQLLFDAWVNSLLVPISYDGRFQIQFPFQWTGNMRGNGRIRLTLALTKLLNRILKSKKGAAGKCQRIYLSMLADDMSKLLDPCLGADDMADLFARVVETMAIRELVYPHSESKSIQHAMLHLVYPRKDIGAVQSYWTLGMERAISSVKKYVPRGGASASKTAMNRYNQFEQSTTKDGYDINLNNLHDFDRHSSSKKRNYLRSLYSPSLYSVEKGQLCYHPFMLRLWREVYLPQKWKSLTAYELEGWISCLKGYVLDRFKNDEQRCKASPFYRLLMAHQVLYENNFFGYQDLVPWFKMLSDIYLAAEGDYANISQLNVNNNSEHVDMAILNHIKRDRVSFNDIREGYFHFSDLVVCKAVVEPVFKVYSNASIYGMRFTGRGIENRETCEPAEYDYRYGKDKSESVRRYHLPQNRLVNHLKYRKDRSSWCKFRRAVRDEKTDHYGMLNFFSRINMPYDPILNGVPFTSITVFGHIMTEGVSDIITTDWNIDASVMFIPLYSVYSSPVAIIPSIGDQPMLTVKNAGKVSKKNKSYFASENQKYPSVLVMIDMFPERFRISFSGEKLEFYNDSKWDGGEEECDAEGETDLSLH